MPTNSKAVPEGSFLLGYAVEWVPLECKVLRSRVGVARLNDVACRTTWTRSAHHVLMAGMLEAGGSLPPSGYLHPAVMPHCM